MTNSGRVAKTFVLIAGVVAFACLAASCGSTGGSAKPAAERTGYAFWPVFPEEPRVQFLRSYGGSADVAPVKSSRLEDIVFGKEQEKDAMINKPYGLAMHDGKVYVCDMRAGSLVVMDLRKKQTRLVGVSGANRLSHPVAVTVADDGTIYVAESDRGAIVVFDSSERYSHSMGFAKFKPVALAIHGDRLYASDMTAQVVQVFDRSSGKQVGTIGSVGDGDGKFRLPLGVATDKSGNVYVVDMMQGRVQKFSPDGAYLASVGTVGDTPGTFARAKHIAVDSDGIVYVVDAAFQNVQMFDDQLRLLLAFGAAGDFPGSMNLPAGISVDESMLGVVQSELHPGFEAKRVIAVTNQFGPAKVSLYALGNAKKGYSAADLARVSAKISLGVGASEETLQMQELGTGTEPAPGPAATEKPSSATVSPK